MLPYIPKWAQLDKLAGAIVRSRGFCECCGVSRNLTWAHIITRGVDHMRWDLDNALCLCWDCHSYYTVHPDEWKIFLFEYIGEEKYWELVRRSNDITLMGQFDKNEIKYRLQKELKRLKIKL